VTPNKAEDIGDSAAAYWWNACRDAVIEGFKKLKDV